MGGSSYDTDEEVSQTASSTTSPSPTKPVATASGKKLDILKLPETEPVKTKIAVDQAYVVVAEVMKEDFTVEMSLHICYMPQAKEHHCTLHMLASDTASTYYPKLLTEIQRCYYLSDAMKYNVYLDNERRVLLTVGNIEHWMLPKADKALDIFVLPANFIMLPVFITADRQFPLEHNHFEKFPIFFPEGLFITAFNPKNDMNAEFRAALQRYSHMLDISDPSLVVDINDMAITAYNCNRSRHINGNTLRHNEVVILKLATANLLLQEHIESTCKSAIASKAKLHPELLVLSKNSSYKASSTKYFVPSQQKVGTTSSSSSTASANSTSTSSASSAVRAPTQATKTQESLPTPAPIAASNTLALEESALKEIIQSYGFQVSNSSMKKLFQRSSTQEGRLNYFLEHSDVFNNDVDEEDPVGLPSQSVAMSVTPPRPPHPPSHFRFESPIQTSLAEQLSTFEIHLTPKNIIALSKRSSTLDGMINYYFSNSEQFQGEDVEVSSSPTGPDFDYSTIPLEPVQRECMICLSEYDISEMYVLNCDANHVFCINCMYRHVHSSVHPTDETVSYIPSCPLANGSTGCKHVLEEREVEQIVNLHQDSDPNDRKQTIALAKKLFYMRCCQSSGCVCCPNCPTEVDGGSWIQLSTSHVGTALGVTCPRCDTVFCSNCKQSPYHYGCPCDQVMTCSRNWLEWCDTGRRRFQEELSSRDEEYRRELESRRKQYEEEVDAVKKRFQELQQTEQLLAQTFKMCPQCKAPIYKIDGCDSMVCGHDYHGNPVGVGCGHRFNWSTAPRYVPNKGTDNTRRIEFVQPEQAQEIIHEIMAGIPLQCDVCSNAVKGPLIKCLNCPAFNMCFRCSSTVDFAAHDRSGHNNQHICQVVFDLYYRSYFTTRS